MLQIILDSIFPPRPTELLLRTAQTSCLATTPTAKRYQQHQYLLPYADPAVEAMIIENKFHHQKQATKLLAAAVHAWHQSQTEPLLYVPIPLSRARKRSRGYNQVIEVLRHVPDVSVAPLLTRRKDTVPQTSLSRRARQQNVRDVFAVNETHVPETIDTTVVIFDDVVTTGATLTAARATLAPHLPPHHTLITLALAH